MSQGEGEDSGSVPAYATARGRDWPSVRQFNVFVENRVGNLLSVVRRFETTDIRIVSLTVIDSADCAIIRMVLSDPERALEIFERAKLPVTESDLLVVQLPESDQPLLDICKALLGRGDQHPLRLSAVDRTAWPRRRRLARRGPRNGGQHVDPAGLHPLHGKRSANGRRDVVTRRPGHAERRRVKAASSSLMSC